MLDLQRFRAAEDEILNGYSWIDRTTASCAIPVDRAIDLLAKQGLPARPQAPPVDRADVPTASGLGPIMQQPGGPLAAMLASTPSTAASATPATASADRAATVRERASSRRN